ncbi:MAG TPA: 4a-hydroxytetrahydrobiopterin dehydratase [Opitutaceae bacterium]|jgi:4a-hydroxytetrahydrobiopterin dehydratase
MSRLKQSEAKRRLRALGGWSMRASVIRRTFVFKGFPQAIRFVGRVARAAQAADHHPDIDIRWNRVTLALTTHSEGGLTAKDFAMARRCSALFPAGPKKS